MTESSDKDRIRSAECVLEQRIVRALEVLPAVRVPKDFAARVDGQLPKLQAFAFAPASARQARYGRSAMLGGLAALLLAMLLLAPQTKGQGALGVTLEWILCTQFIGLALWLSLRRWRLE